MGDVSHVVPAIHPWLAIVDEGEALCHEHRFAEAAGSDRGGSTRPLVAAKAMARTAIEFLADAELRAAVSAEWRDRSSDGDVDPHAVPAWCMMSCTRPWPSATSGRRSKLAVAELEAGTRSVEDDAGDLRPPPAPGPRDAQGEQVARLDPVVGHDDAAHVGAQDGGQRS